MRLPRNMVSGGESADEVTSSHAFHGLLDDLSISPHIKHPSHVQLHTWTSPSSTSARNSPSPSLAEGSIFSPRPPPRYHPNSAPELDLAAPTHVNHPVAPSVNQPSLFGTPNRSIFSSGPPTSPISSNQAQASMSSPSPVHSTTRPLSALTGSSPRKAMHYQSDSQRKTRIPRAEKDVDDPSIPGTFRRVSPPITSAL